VHSTLDLQSSAKDMAKQLSGVEAEYIFFCAYLAKDDEGEAAKVNGAMLQTFLDALSLNGAEKVEAVCGASGPAEESYA
jgi:hypothetical protein